MEDWRPFYNKAVAAPEPRQRLTLLQEGEARFESDVEALLVFRVQMSHSALEIDQPELGLASMLWALQTLDKNPNLSRYLQWMLHLLSWLTNAIQEYPQITLAQRDTILNEYGKRLLQAGYSPRGFVETHSIAASYAGFLKEALHLRLKAQEMPLDKMCNDLAIAVNCLVYLYYQLGNWEETLRTAEPIISGAIKNDVVPRWTYPMIAKAYFKNGDREKGFQYTNRGIRAIEGRDDFEVASELMEDCALIGLTDGGIDLLERHYRLLELSRPLSKYRFYASATLVLNTADRDQQLKIAPSFLEEHKLANNRIGTLLDYFSSQADSLGKAFNERNGNTHWTDYFKQ